jgi:DNA-binding CsgD family transcriptional regulator
MLWNDIVKEVMDRKANGQKACLLNDEEREFSCIDTGKNDLLEKRSLAAYGLGAKYGNMYFTKREAECMTWLLKGKTINSIATILNLSPRTVEYYVKNMKAKIGCRTKFELIDLVYASEFMKSVNFQGRQ